MEETAATLHQSIHDRQAKRKRDSSYDAFEIVESDGVTFEENETSVGTTVKRAAVKEMDAYKQLSPLKQSKVALGLNSIIDLSNVRKDSQRSLFSNDTWKKLQSKLWLSFPQYELSEEVKTILDKVEKVAKTDVKLARRAARKYWSHLDQTDEDVLEIYDHCLSLLCRNDGLFEAGGPNMSENDMIVKIWGPILEILFGSTKLRCKWGETIGDCSIGEATVGFKVDLRVINDERVRGKRKEVDLANGEVSPKGASPAKTSEDRTKLMIEGKCILDALIAILEDDDSPIVPLLQLSGIVGNVISLRLAANGLYVAQTQSKLLIPHCGHTFYQLRKTVESLLTFRVATQKVAHLLKAATPAHSESLRSATSSRSPSPETPLLRQWTRGTWHPPKKNRPVSEFPSMGDELSCMKSEWPERIQGARDYSGYWLFQLKTTCTTIGIED